jgi:hypothetical protein
MFFIISGLGKSPSPHLILRKLYDGPEKLILIK